MKYYHLVTKERITEKPYIHAFSTENMTLLTPGELNMYRRRFLCALYKLTEGLVDKPVNSDKVFKEMDIDSFTCAEQEAAEKGYSINWRVRSRKRKYMTTIHQIDSILITILMNNSTDFLLTNSSHAISPQLIKDEKFILPPPQKQNMDFLL